MRKFLITTLAAGVATSGFYLFAATTSASADSTCGVSGAPVGQYSDAYGNSGVQVCISGTGAADGTVTAAGNPNQSDPASTNGYIIADGASSNPGALAGYVGVSSGDNGGVVGCSSGDYNQAESVEAQGNEAPETTPDQENNQILAIPPALPPAAPDPSGPCSPQPPA